MKSLIFLFVVASCFAVIDRDIYPVDQRKFFRADLESEAVLGDIVAGVGLSGGADNVLPGADADTTLTFDATELDALTWSDGANASNAWIFDVSGTDTTLTFGSALITLTGGFNVGDGSNETLFSATGVQTMAGDARVIKHLHFTMELGKGQSTPTVRFTEDPYASYTYVINDDSHLSREAPDDMDYTVASIVKVHWYTTDPTANGVDEVKWEVQWASRAVGEDITAGDTTGNSGDITCVAANIIVETAIVTISANSIAAGDMVGIHIQRVAVGGGSTDPAGNSVHVIDVELEYTVNKLGSAL